MTMFANCREKFTKNAYPYGTQYGKSTDIQEDEICPYWEGNLEKDGKNEILGFDFAAEQADNFFANLDVNDFLGDYVTGEELRQAMDIAGNMMQKDGDIAQEDFRKATDGCPRIVKAILALRLDLGTWMEMERNQYITSIIDNQPED